MSFQNLSVVNKLQVLPFYDLDDREFSFVIVNWTGQFDELITSGLYNLSFYLIQIKMMTLTVY